MRSGSSQRKGAEPKCPTKDDLLSPEPVAKAAEQHGAQHVTEKTEPEYGREKHLVDLPGLDDGGSGESRDLHVVSLNRHYQGGPEKNGNSKPTKVWAFDDGG